MPDIAKTEPGWYCFKALPKKEHIAARLLRQKPGVEPFCPRIAFTKNTRRGKVRFIECLFPGYLFVHADLGELYRFIRSVQGIKDIVSFGERIPRIPDEFLANLKSRLQEEDELKEVPDPVLMPGMEVTITEGPFRDLNAIVSGDLDGRQRVALLLNFLGRQMEVRLSSEDVLVQDSEPRRGVWD